MTLRVVRDSAGGQKCLIIYRDKQPIATIWEGEDVVRAIAAAGLSDLSALLETTQILGLSFEQLAVTAETFCNESKE